MEKTFDVGADAAIDAAGLETLLGDLEVGEADAVEAIEVIEGETGEVVEASAEDEAAALAELELEEAKGEVYAEAESTGDVVEVVEGEVAAEPAPATEKKTKGTKAPKAPKAPAAPKVTIADLSPEAFVLTTDVPADLAANKAAVIAACPNQKKVREKFENLILSVAAGKKPSTFTVDCYAALKAKGEITTAEMVKILEGEGYTVGTARAQSGQLMALFPAMKVATRDGKKIVLNRESTLAMALDSILGL